MKEKPANDNPRAPQPEQHQQTVREKIGIMSFAQVGLFVLAASYTIYLIRPVLLPLIFALLLTLVLKPVQRRLQKYLRLPAPLAALIVILIAAALAIAAILSLSQPAIKYAEELRGENVKERLYAIAKPFIEVKQEISEVAEEVQKITEPEGKKKVTEADVKVIKEGETLQGPEVDVSVASPKVRNPGTGSGLEVDVSSDEGELSIKSGKGKVDVEASAPPVKVEITNNEDPAKPLYTLATHIAVDLLATLALVFFFLAYGDIMIQRLSEVDAAENLLEQLTRDVSYYLFTITIINAGLGVAVGLAMWLLGMPNPLLWAAMAALFNYVPYLGAIAGTLIVFVVAVITFENTGQTLPVPAAYYILTTIEGNFVTPALIGRKFTINPIIVFTWVFCWGVMWGIPGMLIGLPVLMVFRIVCAKLPSLQRLERVISI